MKLFNVGFVLFFVSGLGFGQSYDRTVVEHNPEPDTTAPAVTVFLDNMRPPHIRIRPSGVTWVDMPYEVRICEASLKFITADALKPKDAQDAAVSILSINVDADKMPDEIKQKLVSGLPVPPVNLNCLLAAGQKSKILVMLELSADASFLVNLQVKKRITLADVGERAKLERPSSGGQETVLAAEGGQRKYELAYYKKLEKLSPSEIHKAILGGGSAQ